MENTKKFIFANKELMKDWHWKKNNELGLDPKNLSMGSNKKAWWQCKNKHEWFTTIYKKVKSKGCPYCSNRFVISGYNDLATKYPYLMNEWDYKKNIGLNPNILNTGSEKKVWWICSKCGNNWEASIKNRMIGHGCHRCSKIIRGNNKHNTTLLKKGPIRSDLLIEWNYKKNNDLNPYSFHGNENKKVWWICSKCKYEWIASIRNRAYLKRGCPCCAKKIIVKGINDLATINPELLKEWDYKNNFIKPDEVASGSRRKVWWICPKGHSYQASLLHRRHGTKCPICNSGRQTSFAEQCVFYYVKKLYPDAINRYKADWLNKMELDIFIPSINYAIEYDGIAWHKKDKIEREQRKYELCKCNNIKLIRLREDSLNIIHNIADFQYCCKDLYQINKLQPIIIKLLKRLCFNKKNTQILVDIEKDRLEIEEYLQELSKNSFADHFPELLKEWNYKKNGTLKPNMFKTHSDQKVWWICSVCGYEYKSTISARSYGSGCRKCGLKQTAKARSKKVKMIDCKTYQIIKEFNSIAEASKETNICRSAICTVCQKKQKKAGGYIWEYII